MRKGGARRANYDRQNILLLLHCKCLSFVSIVFLELSLFERLFHFVCRTKSVRPLPSLCDSVVSSQWHQCLMLTKRTYARTGKFIHFFCFVSFFLMCCSSESLFYLFCFRYKRSEYVSMTARCALFQCVITFFSSTILFFDFFSSVG